MRRHAKRGGMRSLRARHASLALGRPRGSARASLRTLCQELAALVRHGAQARRRIQEARPGADGGPPSGVVSACNAAVKRRKARRPASWDRRLSRWKDRPDREAGQRCGGFPHRAVRRFTPSAFGRGPATQTSDETRRENEGA
jgi:hypothetical protein